jgi:hypothetical protein
VDCQPHPRFTNGCRRQDRFGFRMSPSRIKNNQANHQNMLHISRPHPTPTATLIETTRGLAFRSQAINYAMQNAGGERQERGERGERGGRGGRGGRGRGGGGAGREQPNGDAQE